MANLLLIEDELTNQKIVAAALSQHKVVIAPTLDSARKSLTSEQFDLVLLDVQLPDGDGFSFFLELQSIPMNQETPVVFLTSRMEVSDKVTGYTLGADDYITKPIHPLEFKARMEAKLRKLESRNSQGSRFRKDGFVFSLDKQTVVFEGSEKPMPLEMTTLEFKLFLYLIRHKDHVLSREKLIQDVWGDNLNVSDRTIDTHMSHLRKRLQGTTLTVQSVYGAGYRLSNTKTAA